MKKIIIAIFLFLIVSLCIVIIAYAKDFIHIQATSWVVDAEVFPKGVIKKFKDGNNVCYVYQTATSPSISCVKGL